MLVLKRSLKDLAKMSKLNAACVIIGDEVLNGKIVDTNSKFFAKYCYDQGIRLNEIVTIGDEESQIVETLQRLCKNHQFIVTSGGIGPTHDDITYESVAKSFGLPTKIDEECKKHMQRLSKPESRLDAEALKDFYRMATLPYGPGVKNYRIAEDLWVPICSINHTVYVLPGIPQLFTRMLKEFTPTLREIYKLAEDKHEYVRFFLKTTLMEAQVSAYLRNLQQEASKISDDIKIGSYPHFGMGFNTISLLGTKDHEAFLKSLNARIIRELHAESISAEDEENISNSFQA